MKRMLRVGAVVALMVATMVGAASAAQVDYFLKLDGIEGESKDAKHPNEIQLLSFSQETTQGGSFAAGHGGAGGAGKASLGPVVVTKRVDKASPRLFLACCSGQHIKSAVLIARKAGKDQQEFLRYDLTDVLISSYRVSGAEDPVPTEAISLEFATIRCEYKPQKPDGSLDSPVVGGWDVRTNSVKRSDGVDAEDPGKAVPPVLQEK